MNINITINSGECNDINYSNLNTSGLNLIIESGKNEINNLIDSYNQQLNNILQAAQNDFTILVQENQRLLRDTSVIYNETKKIKDEIDAMYSGILSGGGNSTQNNIFAGTEDPPTFTTRSPAIYYVLGKLNNVYLLNAPSGQLSNQWK